MKRDVKTKRQLSEAAVEPRQSRLFEPEKAKLTASATGTSLASDLDQSTSQTFATSDLQLELPASPSQQSQQQQFDIVCILF